MLFCKACKLFNPILLTSNPLLFSDPESVIHYKQGYRENITVTVAEIDDLRSSILLAQVYSIFVFVVWSLVATLILLLPIYFTIGLRMPTQEEILGPDFVEHGIIHEGNRQLLNIVRQKIRYVHRDGMSDTQVWPRGSFWIHILRS